jgi:hypothetical protein
MRPLLRLDVNDQLARRKGLSAYLDRVDARTRAAEPAPIARAA